MSKRAKAALALFLSAVGLGTTLGAGCDTVDWSPTDNEPTGTMRMLVTDKPYPVQFLDEASVTVTQVEVRRAKDGNKRTPRGGPKFLTVFEGTQTISLLDLRNGYVDLLAESDLPTGSYDQVRLIVSDGYVRLTDGREFELTVPSGDETGIKLNVDFTVGENGEGLEALLLLDVDLSRAFKALPGGKSPRNAGEITGFQFRPRVAMRLVDMNATGDVAGVVVDSGFNALDSVVVTAYLGDTEVTSTVTDPDGTFRILGLAPGNHRLEFSRYLFLDQTVEDVFVTASEVTEVGVVTMLPVE